MINISKESIHHIPVLHIVKQDKSKEKLPFIIFIHGITSAKEHNLHYAYLLAEKGFRVILPDALYHGEREADLSENKLMLSFWDIVIKTIAEIEVLKDYYESQGSIDSSRIGIAGTSMGGIITYGALTKYSWIKAGVSLMGNPAYVSYAKRQIEALRQAKMDIPLTDEELENLYSLLAPYDITLNTEKLAGRPVFLWHGEKDNVVPFQDAYNFYESMSAEYGNDRDKIAFLLDKNASHKVSREGLLRTQEWFVKHL
ncbi:prolyl oligopeptidase family serine peptidase [Peribacillus deserti]|uniref:Esterase n=1 Tax=Peribacillus deserti TaxID=673318 RepID=A0A2N5M7S0_9BACI|nr:prolyl oligopeptidase family serine peptidase [Peribacillus deserti]PLT30410.1 esterase [Peribacillus deserti]